jgi:hypothetical protein
MVNENNKFSETINIFDDSNLESSDEDKFLGKEDKSLLETKVNTPANPTHDHTYFRNKIVEQYPDLYWEGRDGNNDYYGITDESLCPLCKLDHYEDYGIKGRYKTGSYFIKCK